MRPREPAISCALALARADTDAVTATALRDAAQTNGAEASRVLGLDAARGCWSLLRLGRSIRSASRYRSRGGWRGRCSDSRSRLGKPLFSGFRRDFSLGARGLRLFRARAQRSSRCIVRQLGLRTATREREQ